MRWPWSRRRRRSEQVRLVKVAYARNQPEAEMIEQLLRQNGIPSLTQRNGGFDVPDFLAAGPRDILVPESGAEAAREALAPQGLAGESSDGAAEAG